MKRFDFDNILLNKKSHKNILICNISYKNLICTKPLRIRFNEVDRNIRDYDGTRYIVLFRPEKYDVIYNKIRYLVSHKSDIIYVFLIVMQKLK